MGVKGLWSLLEPLEGITPSDLRGKKMAIDTFGLMYHNSSSSSSTRNSTDGFYDRSQLLGLLKKILQLLHLGIFPLFIFDGKPPQIKRDCLAMRKAQMGYLSTKGTSDPSLLRRVVEQQRRRRHRKVAKRMISMNLLATDNAAAEVVDNSLESGGAHLEKEFLSSSSEEEDYDLESTEFLKELSVEKQQQILLKKIKKSALLSIATQQEQQEQQEQSYLDSFSKQQITSLLERRKLTKVLERTAAIGKEEGCVEFDDIGRRVAHDHNSRFVLLKKISSSGDGVCDDGAAKKEDSSIDSISDDVAIESLLFDNQSDVVKGNVAYGVDDDGDGIKNNASAVIISDNNDVVKSNDDDVVVVLSDNDDIVKSTNVVKGNVVDIVDDGHAIKDYNDTKDDGISVVKDTKEDSVNEMCEGDTCATNAPFYSRTTTVADDISIENNSTTPECVISNVLANDDIVDTKVFVKEISSNTNKNNTNNNSTNNNNNTTPITKEREEVDQELIYDLKDLLSIFGIPYRMAKNEAEKEAVGLERLGIVDGVVSDDSDCLLLGSSLIGRNFFKRKPLLYSAAACASKFGEAKLKSLAILLGCDYCIGVPGIGPKRAVKIVDHLWKEGDSPSMLIRRISDFFTGSLDVDGDVFLMQIVQNYSLHVNNASFKDFERVLECYDLDDFSIEYHGDGVVEWDKMVFYNASRYDEVILKLSEFIRRTRLPSWSIDDLELHMRPIQNRWNSLFKMEEPIISS